MDHNHCLLQSKFFQEVLSHLYDTIYPLEGFLNGDLEFCPLAALLETFIAMKNLQTEITSLNVKIKNKWTFEM